MGSPEKKNVISTDSSEIVLFGILFKLFNPLKIIIHYFLLAGCLFKIVKDFVMQENI